MSISSTSSSSSGSSLNAIYNSTNRLTGLFSSFDTDALVKSMTSTAQSKIDAVKKKQALQEWYNDALQGVKDDINEFLNTYVSPTGSSSMLKASSYSTQKAVTSSTANAVSVTAAGTGTTGDFSIKIMTLAKNASTESTAQVSKSGVISDSNTETLENLAFATPLKFNSADKISFSINGKSFEFSKDTTLQSMINTINTDKTANVTMKYSRLSDTFSITADSGGADSGVIINNYAGNAFGTNSAFKIGSGTFLNGRSDATAEINGVTVTRDTNEFTIDNITYNLKKVTEGTDEETVELTLERDYSVTVDAVKKFVEGYNKLYEKLKALVSEKDYSSDYPPLTDAQKEDMTTEEITAWEKKAKSGVLRNNSDLESLMTNLRSAFYTALGGIPRNASEIGLSTAGYYDDNAGSVIFDEDAFTAALQENAGEIIDMFTNGSSTAPVSEQGLIYKLKSSITAFTDTLKDSMETADSKIDSYDKAIDSLEDKLEDLADRYYNKFANMETALSKLNSQASFISQMFTSS